MINGFYIVWQLQIKTKKNKKPQVKKKHFLLIFKILIYFIFYRYYSSYFFNQCDFGLYLQERSREGDDNKVSWIWKVCFYLLCLSCHSEVFGECLIKNMYWLYQNIKIYLWLTVKPPRSRPNMYNNQLTLCLSLPA